MNRETAEQMTEHHSHPITSYELFLAERQQILRHKWLESEKAGGDIGWERALFDWVQHHRSHWLRKMTKGLND